MGRTYTRAAAKWKRLFGETAQFSFGKKFFPVTECHLRLQLQPYKAF
ncbi:hypothetical protein Pan44_32000 [Caulifigura coniformis]|uniref:Uncharacterized protein n=1 Tax=Caulifigura coniformis TaxID=2527983 RepID=A0A517SGB2_9PLAN|nr:hypothetical protein Pan44_32000 [Caulifigura coniformis]